MREYLEHLTVVGEHGGFELGDSALARDECEMFQQDRADAMSLIIIHYRECDLGTTPISSAQVAADADEALASILCECCRETDVIVEIEFSQPLEILP